MYNKFYVLISVLSVFTYNAISQVNSNVQAFYPFHGNANNGLGTGVDDFQLVGSPTLAEDRFGNVDCAYEFPGDSIHYLTIPNPSNNVGVNYTDGWSISLWYQGGSSEIGDLEHIFTQGSAISICNQISIYDLNKPMVEVLDFNPTAVPIPALVVWADDLPNLNHYMDSTIWHHVVLTVKPNQYVNLYVDNVLQSESLVNQNVDDYCGSPITVGKSFHGKVDDIVIYHQGLSSIDVDSLFNMTAFCSQSVLGVNELNQEPTMEIYPNPATEQFTLRTKHMNDHYRITNVLGHMVKNGEIMAQETIVTVNDLPAGTYFLTIDSEINVNYKLVIIQ